MHQHSHVLVVGCVRLICPEHPDAVTAIVLDWFVQNIPTLWTAIKCFVMYSVARLKRRYSWQWHHNHLTKLQRCVDVVNAQGKTMAIQNCVTKLTGPNTVGLLWLYMSNAWLFCQSSNSLVSMRYLDYQASSKASIYGLSGETLNRGSTVYRRFIGE